MPKEYLSIASSVLLFILALAAVVLWPRSLPRDAAESVAASAACAHIEPDLSLMAQAAYAIDLKTGRTLYTKNANAQLPFASLAKLATIATARQSISPDDTVVISREALTPEGDSGFKMGEEWRAADLIDFTLITSSNDGAHAIALAASEKKNETLEAFIQNMNDVARSLGMNETFFTNDTGLDISSTTASAYGSARDMATLITHLVKADPRLVEGSRDERKTFVSLSGYTHVAQNTSDVIGTLSGAVASKTGYTDLAGGNLAVVFEPLLGRPVAAVVLGSTRDGRNADMEALARGAKSALTRVIICTDGLGSP
ncbi:D-alanyl-D-alanine carboxypeptidase [Candidatus Kaiserbacteria bacterium]|nr:D-alanyl-D-alanine carboxypeptidase [Candidatus Kaiserbacteria bacterium]